jgi:hypothetical protein
MAKAPPEHNCANEHQPLNGGFFTTVLHVPKEHQEMFVVTAFAEIIK